jgi:hypothetical protein
MPRKRISVRESKQLSRRFHAGHNNWSFSNLITQVTKDPNYVQSSNKVVDDVSKAYSTFTESSSRCSNDDYSSECYEDDWEDN